MSQSVRFDNYLNASTTEILQPMARVWGGKGNLKKQECVALIKRGLQDAAKIKAVMANLQPYEQLALELTKQQGGMIEVAELLRSLRLMGVTLPEFKQLYLREDFLLAKALMQRGIFLSQAPLNPNFAYSGSVYSALTLIVDERLLEQVGDFSTPVSPLSPIAPPARSTSRRPANVVLSLIGTLQAIADLGGLKLTRANIVQINSVRKLTKAQKWQDDSITIDGLQFPEPSEAFIYAFRHAGLLQETASTLILSAPVEQFAARPYTEQVGSVVQGLLQTMEWLEWQPRSGYDRLPMVMEGRNLVLFALKLLSPDPEAWYALEDLNNWLFERMGEHFSIQFKPQHHVYHRTPEDAQAALAKWRQQLRQNWSERERPWLKYVFSTWLYYLGMVELGISQLGSDAPLNERVVSFRLTDLGRSMLHPHLAVAIDPTATQTAWIVQPNFEVMVYLEEVTPLQLAFLERHAERMDQQQHIAQYRLTRESVYRGLESGSSLEELLTGLQTGAKVALPQNVEIDLRQWGDLREQVTLWRYACLLEFPDAKTCQAAIAQGLKGRLVGDRFILPTDPLKCLSWVSRTVDYDAPLPSCIAITETGLATLTKSPDLLIESQLNNWLIKQSDDTWQLTQATVAAAVNKGGRATDLFNLLEERLTHRLPLLLGEAIKAWAGSPATVEMTSVLVLRCVDPNVLLAITQSKKLKPFLLGKLAPDVLLVDGKQLKALSKELAWVGFKIAEQLLDVPQLK